MRLGRARGGQVGRQAGTRCAYRWSLETAMNRTPRHWARGARRTVGWSERRGAASRAHLLRRAKEARRRLWLGTRGQNCAHPAERRKHVWRGGAARGSQGGPLRQRARAPLPSVAAHHPRPRTPPRNAITRPRRARARSQAATPCMGCATLENELSAVRCDRVVRINASTRSLDKPPSPLSAPRTQCVAAAHPGWKPRLLRLAPSTGRSIALIARAGDGSDGDEDAGPSRHSPRLAGARPAIARACRPPKQLRRRARGAGARD